MLYFEEFAADPDRRELRRGDVLLHLHPRAFDTLLYLLQHPGRVLTKDELLQAIWTDVSVGDNTLAQSIREIRETLGDHVHQPRFIRTVPRKGYLFLPPVRLAPEHQDPLPAWEEPLSPTLSAPPIASEIPVPDSPVPRKLPTFTLAFITFIAVLVAGWGLWRWQRNARSEANALNPVAVLSFRVVGNPNHLQWLDRGLVDMVTTDLAQDPGLHVISYARVLDGLRSQPHGDSDSLRLARSVGARTAITGTFVVTGNRFQLDVQATRVDDGQVISSFQTRGQTADGILNAVDEVCSQMRRRLTDQPFEPQSQASVLPTRSLAAYQHYLAGLDDSADGSHASLIQAGIEFQKALSIDPDFMLAALHLSQVVQQEKSWNYPVTVRPVPLPPSNRLRTPVRLLAEARLHPELPVSVRLGDLRELTTRYPDFSLEEGVPVDLIYAEWEAGQPQKAIADGLHYATNPELASFYRMNLYTDMSRIYEGLGEYRHAIRVLKASLQLRHRKTGEGYVQQQYWLGRMYAADLQPQRALAIFNQLRPGIVAGRNAILLTDLAWGYYFIRHRRDSETLVREALAATPGYWNAWHLQGWLDLTGGRPAAAIHEFAQAYQLSPEHDVPSLYYEGVAQREAGQPAPARQTFQLMRKITSSGTWSTNTLPKSNTTMRLIALSLADGQLGNLDQSRLEADAAFRSAQGHPEELYACAEAFAVLNDPHQMTIALRGSLKAGYINLQHIRDNPSFRGPLHPLMEKVLTTWQAGRTAH